MPRTKAQLEADRSRSEKLKAYHSKKAQKLKEYNHVAIAAQDDRFPEFFRSLAVTKVISILDSTYQGDLKRWMEFVDKMKEGDPDLRGLMDVRVNAISGKNMRIESDGKTTSAIQAEQFISDQFKRIRKFNVMLRHLLSATFSGVALVELDWDYDVATQTYYVCKARPVHGKKLEIALVDGEFRYLLKKEYVAEEFRHLCDAVGLDIMKHLPHKFLLHSPDETMMEHARGLLRSAALFFFFKRLGWTHYIAGSQKHAYPKLWASVPPNTDLATKKALAQNLANLKTDNHLVVESPAEINSIPEGVGGNATWSQLVKDVNATYAKLILGGTLNVDTDGKGSYNLGSVHERVRMDLLMADAEALQETLIHQLVDRLLRMNLHKFEGKMPALPTVWFDVTKRTFDSIQEWHTKIPEMITKNQLLEDLGFPKIETGDSFITEKNESKTSQIFQYHLQGKLVTRNEVRKQLGLPPHPDEDLGNELLDLVPGGDPDAALSVERYLELENGGSESTNPLAVKHMGQEKWGTSLASLMRKRNEPSEPSDG